MASRALGAMRRGTPANRQCCRARKRGHQDGCYWCCRVPTLRRPDARHPDLRQSSAYPRIANFTELALSIRASVDQSSPSALPRAKLTRTPIVIAAHIQRSRRPQPSMSGPSRHAGHEAAPGICLGGSTIELSKPIGSVQIPIAHRSR
jgi:hypothetical protein